MKKWMFVTIVISLVLALTACGSAQTATATVTATTLSMEGQLLVGTLKLEDTTLAITSDQATQLLPLWETLASLASSSTAASQEVDAVVSQIKSTMNPEQVSKITAMKLTQQDLATVAESAGLSSTSSSSTSTTTKTSVSAAQSQQDAGGQGGGNPPSDTGGGMSSDTGLQLTGQSQTGTTQTVSTQTTSTTSQISAELINTVVTLLQEKLA